MRTVHIDASTRYDVLIGANLIDRAGALTAEAVKPCRCAIVADDTVDALYGARVHDSFQAAGFDAVKTAFPAGEGSKHIGTLSDILEFLAERRLTRADLVVALGGGVTGDMAGFAAAVYARGIRFVQIPTTLLSAVDSRQDGHRPESRQEPGRGVPPAQPGDHRYRRHTRPAPGAARLRRGGGDQVRRAVR